MKDWYSPRDIYFEDRDQIIWLLEILPTLREGRWPPQPSSYLPANVSTQRSSKAHFETPIQIESELTRRLEAACQDGAIVLMMYCFKETPESLSKYFRCSYEEVNRRAESVLNFIMGFNFYHGKQYRRRDNHKEGTNGL